MGQAPTLSEFHRDVFVPVRTKQLDEKTARGYAETVKLWEKIVGPLPLDQVTDETAAEFVARLHKEKGKKGLMMKSSIAKHCTNLKSMFHVAGPRALHPQGKNIITIVPFVPTPKVPPRLVTEVFTIDEIRLMYKFADAATKPNLLDVESVDWWRAFISWTYLLGLRVESAILARYDMIKDGWVWLTADIMKQDHEMKQFIHPIAMEHIERIRRPDRAIILEWPGWPKTRRTLYDQLHRIQNAAGMPEDRWFGCHAFRRSHTSEMQESALDQNQILAITQRSVGHSTSEITKAHYISTAVQDRMQAAAIMTLPSPVPEDLRDRANPRRAEPRSERLRRDHFEYRRPPEDFID